MRPPSLADAEWTVMEALWANAPQTASELTRHLRPATGWAENTVRTLLTRLMKKKALKTQENTSGTRLFLPAFEREAYVRSESASFMDRIFRGASKPLLVHFAQNAHLTPAEVRELKRLLDQSLKNQP
jgi:BlaI family transcriptional regulator, penicillinase repressor